MVNRAKLRRHDIVIQHIDNRVIVWQGGVFCNLDLFHVRNRSPQNVFVAFIGPSS